MVNEEEINKKVNRKVLNILFLILFIGLYFPPLLFISDFIDSLSANYPSSYSLLFDVTFFFILVGGSVFFFFIFIMLLIPSFPKERDKQYHKELKEIQKKYQGDLFDALNSKLIIEYNLRKLNKLINKLENESKLG